MVHIFKILKIKCPSIQNPGQFFCQDYTSTAQGHQAHKTLAQATKGKVSDMEER